jgi:ATP-dependent Lhr-like helicase
LERHILPARVRDYDPRDLDALLSGGLVVWTGVEPIAQNDGRIALYLAEHAPRLVRPPLELENLDPLHSIIREALSTSGALFFPQILAATGNAFKGDVLRALWDLVWVGEVTNDTLLPVRALWSSGKKKRKIQRLGIPAGRSSVPPEAAGRWSLVRNFTAGAEGAIPTTERLASLAHQLLNRLGVVTREGVAAEKIGGGFSSVYPVFKLMEESGKIRRGYFIAGRGAAQFATAGALDRLRDFRDADSEPNIVMLSASDPANPYGAVLPWPERTDTSQPNRAAGSQVLLVDGELVAFLSRGERNLLTFTDPAQIERQASGIARALANEVESGKRRALVISAVDGRPPGESFLASALQREGFVPFTHGWQKRIERKD